MTEVSNMAASSMDTNFDSQKSNVMKFSHHLHANALLNSLNEIRKNPQLCDCAVVIHGTEVPVQRSILAAASPYFRALFSFDVSKKDPTFEKVMLNMDRLTSAIFQQILDYIYTSEIYFSEDNIQEIVEVADLLLMSDLKELCCDYLEQCITTTNCLGIRDFTERFSCPRTHFAAINFIDEHFLQVSFLEEFLQLPLDKMKEILQRDTLTVEDEDAIFDSARRWVEHDLENRKEHLQELLLSCVHLGLLRDSFLRDHVMADQLIQSCQLQNIILKNRQEDQARKLRGFTNVIIVAGGEGPKETEPSVVETKTSVRCAAMPTSSDNKVTSWIELAPMVQPRIGHGLVQCGGCLYAIGGRDNSGRILNTGERYDPNINTWTNIEPMAHARVGFGIVSIDEKIYVLGGSNDMTDPLTSVEEYNIYTKTWKSLPDMNLKRAWSACAACSKKIYVIGGGILGKLYEAVECFDPKSETWVSVAPMRERRFDARAIGLGDDIYVFGGLRRLECPSVRQNTSGMKFCETEVYSTEHKQWMSLNRNGGMCTMTDLSHIDSVFEFGGEIFLIGDLDVGKEYNFIRAVNPATETWRGIVQNPPPSQRGVQACVTKVPTALLYDLTWKQGKLTFKDVKGYMAKTSPQRSQNNL